MKALVILTSNEGLKIGASLKLYLVMMIVGICIAILFDFFRGVRKATKTAYREITPFVHIEDILFVLSSFILFIFAVIVYNDGEIRGYMILGLITGILLYWSLLSRISNKMFFWTVYILIKVFSFPVKILMRIAGFFVRKYKILYINRRKADE